MGDKETLQRSQPSLDERMSDSQSEPRDEYNQVRCKKCRAVTRLAHKILNARSGAALRMYKCEYGEQVWIEIPV
jgi:hypothetical protein